MPRSHRHKKHHQPAEETATAQEEGEVYTQDYGAGSDISQPNFEEGEVEDDDATLPSSLPGLEAEYDAQAKVEAEKKAEHAAAEEKKSKLASISDLYVQACEATKPDATTLMDAACVWWNKKLAFGKFKGFSPVEVLTQPAAPGQKTPEAYLRWMVNTIMKEEDPDLAKYIFNNTMRVREKPAAKAPRTSVKDTEAERQAKREKRRKEAAAKRAARPKPKTKAEIAKELQDLKNRLAPASATSNSGYEDDVCT